MRLFLCLLFCALSCGKPIGRKEYVEPDLFISPVEVADIVNNQKMGCLPLDPKTPCPSGIVRLLTKNRKSPSRWSVCSGFMVSPTSFVTNHHCISSQKECDDTYVIIYRHGKDPLKTSCKNLVAAQNDGLDVNDPQKLVDVTVAQIKDIYEGDLLPSQTKPLSPSESVRLWVVDHTGTVNHRNFNFHASRVTELKCDQVTPEDPNFRQRSSQVLNLKSCPVIGGNSGSVVLTEDGFLAGVVFAGNSDSILANESLTQWRRTGPDARRGLALATPAEEFTRFISQIGELTRSR